MSPNCDTTSTEGSNTPIAEQTPRATPVQASTPRSSLLNADHVPRAFYRFNGMAPSRSLIEHVAVTVVETVDFALGRPSSFVRGPSITRHSEHSKFLKFVTDVLCKVEVKVPPLLCTLVYIERAKPRLPDAFAQWARDRPPSVTRGWIRGIPWQPMWYEDVPAPVPIAPGKEDERVFLGALILACKLFPGQTTTYEEWEESTGEVFRPEQIGRIEREFLAVLGSQVAMNLSEWMDLPLHLVHERD